MHELSIALRIVEEVTRLAAAEPGRVTRVVVGIGVLAGVHAPSLEQAFAIAAADGPLAAATLEIVPVPVRVWCESCAAEGTLGSLTRLACPGCGRPCGAIRSGHDLVIESIVLEEDAAGTRGAHGTIAAGAGGPPP